MTTKPLAAWAARTAKRVIAFVALAAFAGQLSAATVTGIIKDRRGNLVSTNINFRSLQRPIFLTPWIQPGWNVSTNSDTNGVFTIALTAGEYGVAIGSDQRDSFIIAVPNTSSNYTLAQVITSRLTYTYTFSPQYEQLLNRDVAGGYAGLDASWGRLPSWLLATNSPSAGDTIYSDGTFNWWAPPGTGSGADASIGYVLTTSNTLYVVTMTASNALQTQITAAPTTSQLLAASNALNAKVDLRLSTVQFLNDSNALVSYANAVTNSSIARQTQLTSMSNALVSLIGSGGAGNAITNNETRDLVFNAGALFNGSTTNNGVVRFEDDIVQVAGNSATFGNVSVAGTLTVGAATVATLNNLATSSNAIRSAYTTDLLGASNALTTKMELRVAVSDFLLASNALRNDIDLKVTTASLNAASNALVAYANAVTNSSIVRQTQLTAASNDLMSAISTLTTAVGLKANTTDLLGASNVVSAKVDLRLLTTQFLLDSNTLQTAIDTKVGNSTLLGASNALVSYANGTTNTSIVRQTQLTAASNAIVALIGSGSGNPLTNNDSRDLVFNGGARFEGATTNANIAYFQDDIFQVAGNSATLGNVSVAGTLTVGAATVATLNNLATSSNALRALIDAADLKIGVASNALNSRVSAALTNNETRAITFTSDFNVSGDAAFAGPVEVIGQLWPKGGLSPLGTNLMRSLTEDTLPATNDFLLSWDASANSLKQTALNSLPVSYRAQLAINAASNSIINGGLLMPYDVDLADIAALTTTSYGIGILQMASAATAKSYLGVPTDITTTSNALRTAYLASDAATSNALSSAKQDADTDLSAVAGLSGAGLIARTGAGTAAARTLTGTASEITVANGTGASGDPTISLPSTIDLGGKTSLELPNGSSPTVDAFGEIAGDSNLWGASRGGVVWFDGTSVVGLVPVLASDVPSAGQVPTWNASGYALWETPTGGAAASTNEARFFYGARNGMHTISARSNVLGWVTTTMTSNFTANAAGTIVTNAVAGYYEISAGYSFNSVSNNVWAVKVTTNGTYADNLTGYTEYTGGTGVASLSTNSVAMAGAVYLPANCYVSVYSDYLRNASGEISYNAGWEYLIIRPLDSPGGGTITINSGGSGSASNALAWIASNGVPVSGSVTGLNFTLSSGLLGSFTNTSGLVDYGLAIDTSILPTHTQLVAASNALRTAFVSNDTTTSNGVLTAAQSYANGVTNSSIARQTQLTSMSNALVSLIGTGNGSTSNSIPVISITTNFNVGFGTFQSGTMVSGSNQFLNFQGTATNGDAIEVAVTNVSNTNISISLNANGSATTFYDPTVRTNVAAFGIPPGARIVEFVYSTNWGGIWRLNASIGPEPELVAGYATQFSTNSGGTIITNGVSSVLQGLHANASTTPTNTARGFGANSVTASGVLTTTITNAITYPPTNTTSLHIDWTGTEIVMIPLLLETNLVLIPTNMVIGRPLTVIARASGVTYNLSISNAAGTRILYPLGSTNSGNAALTVTNGQQIELNLLPLTNGISAAFGRFQ